MQYNAAGPWSKTKDALIHIASNDAYTGILSGTYTLQPREGNSGCVMLEDGDFTINCIGLRNSGIHYGIKLLESIDTTKQKYISILGDDIFDKDYPHIPSSIIPEINISCPNVTNHTSIETILDRAEVLFHQYGIKLPPYTSESSIKELCIILLNPKYTSLKYIVCSNTIGCCVMIHPTTNMPIIGGLSGCKYLSMGNVYLFSRYLQGTIKVIGCGGILTEKDVNDYYICGADGVQIGRNVFRAKL